MLCTGEKSMRLGLEVSQTHIIKDPFISMGVVKGRGTVVGFFGRQ